MAISKLGKFILMIAALQFAFILPVVLNIPIARQAIVFACLIFIPGTIILKALRLDELHLVEKVVFSVGFSIVFLMIVGLVINEIGGSRARPLSELPLMLVLDGALISMFVLGYLTNKEYKFPWITDLKLSPSITSAIPFALLPILSIVGAIWVNAYGDNRVLLFLIATIAVLFAFCALSEKVLPVKLYPFALFSIAIALLFHYSLISSYVIGPDIQLEYYSFRVTQDAAHWSSVIRNIWDYTYGRFNSMISITILPTILSNLLNLNATWTLKIVYPIIFSFVPLSLYQLWQTFMGKKAAFVTTFFFMAQLTFYTDMLALAREMVAELFFVLLLFVLLNNKMKLVSRKLCFIIFSTGLVLSHYSMSYIFLFYILLVLILLFLVKRPSTTITLSMVAFFFGIMFSWYIFTSSSGAFTSLVTFGDNVYNDLGGFLSIESRGSGVMRGLGLESSPTPLNTASRIFAYATQFLILVGFIVEITGRTKKRARTPATTSPEYMAFSTMNIALLALLILVPGLALTMRIERFYHILLFVLAPFCVLGAQKLVSFVSTSKTESKTIVLLLVILIPYFLFQTSFIYEVTGSRSQSIPLSRNHMDRFLLFNNYGYIDEQSVSGVEWMSDHLNLSDTSITGAPLSADLISTTYVLTSYGMYRGELDILSRNTVIRSGEAVYLSSYNVIDGKFRDSSGTLKNITDISSLLDKLNKLYSNGASEIYQNS